MSTTPEQTGRFRGTSLDRRVVIGIAAGLVVLLALVWLLVLRGEPEPQPAAAPAPAPEAKPAPEPKKAKKPSKKPGGGPVETFQVFAPRDPFDPLVSASSGGGGTTSATTTGTGGTSATTISNGGQTSGGGSPAGGASVSGHTVSVVDVFRARKGRRAQVKVDGTVYTVDQGERFAGSFELLSTSDTCANMLFGDDQFRLCEGEQILK